jgi:hypothetical protein
LAWGWHGVGMGPHGVGMGLARRAGLAWGLALARGWHRAGRGWHGVGMGWNGVGMGRMTGPHGDGPTGPQTAQRRAAWVLRGFRLPVSTRALRGGNTAAELLPLLPLRGNNRAACFLGILLPAMCYVRPICNWPSSGHQPFAIVSCIRFLLSNSLAKTQRRSAQRTKKGKGREQRGAACCRIAPGTGV